MGSTLSRVGVAEDEVCKPKNDEPQQPLPFNKKYKLQICRASVAVLLFFSALIFSVETYHLLWKAENDAYNLHYKSISGELIQEMSTILKKLHEASMSMATSASLAHPNSSSWPNASITGYVLLNKHLSLLANAKVTLTPIVWPEEVSSFEAYAREAFIADPDVPEETAGYNDFGFGVFAFDENRNRIHDTTGVTNFSENNFLTPILMSAFPSTSKAFLYNTHSDIIRGTAMDHLYSCAMMFNRDEDCSILTDIIQHVSDANFRPTTLLYSPIFAHYDDVLVGISTLSFQWDNMLIGTLSSLVDSVEFVVATNRSVFTIEIHEGEATFKGGGDLHNRRFDSAREAVFFDLNPVGTCNQSTRYSISVYPTLELYNAYHSNIPIIATTSCISLIILTMMVILAYDKLITVERFTKDNLLKHKRDFVRFVSHEVRTPLNSVSLGLRYLEEELLDAIGFIHMFPTASGAGNEGIREEENLGTNGDDCAYVSPKRALSPTKSSKSIKNSTRSTTSNMDNMRTYLALVREIQNSSIVAVSVLNDFLLYDKIEAGTMVMERKAVPVYKIITDNVKLFLIQATESKIRVVLTFDEDSNGDTSSDGDSTRLAKNKDWQRKISDFEHSISPIPVNQEDLCIMGDCARIGQVIRNLVSNAIKFSSSESVLTISVKWRMNGLPTAQEESCKNGNSGDKDYVTPSGSVLLCVTDRGPGMSSDEISMLFGEGVQFNPNDLQGGQGSGLGLWISKGIVDRHKGHIWAESEGEGWGCKFFAELPVVRCADVKTEDVSEEDEVSEAMKRSLLSVEAEASVDREKRKLCVLVVDDVQMNRKCVVRLLERRNYQCICAENGLEAVELMHSEQGPDVDCILMDNEMPKVGCCLGSGCRYFLESMMF